MDCEFRSILGWLQSQITSLESEILNSIRFHLWLNLIKGILAGVDSNRFQHILHPRPPFMFYRNCQYCWSDNWKYNNTVLGWVDDILVSWWIVSLWKFVEKYCTHYQGIKYLVILTIELKWFNREWDTRVFSPLWNNSNLTNFYRLFCILQRMEWIKEGVWWCWIHQGIF